MTVCEALQVIEALGTVKIVECDNEAENHGRTVYEGIAVLCPYLRKEKGSPEIRNARVCLLEAGFGEITIYYIAE